jgi:hypothetical protein
VNDVSPGRSPHDFVVAAVHLLDYAVAGDDVRRARQALSEIGRAAAAYGWGPFLDAPDPDTVRLRELAGSAPALLARAVSSAVSAVRRYGADGVLDALYARSGYQSLLDQAVWAEPERGPSDLADVDEDLADEIGDVEVADARAPESVPDSHAWWSVLR